MHYSSDSFMPLNLPLKNLFKLAVIVPVAFVALGLLAKVRAYRF